MSYRTLLVVGGPHDGMSIEVDPANKAHIQLPVQNTLPSAYYYASALNSTITSELYTPTHMHLDGHERCFLRHHRLSVVEAWDKLIEGYNP